MVVEIVIVLATVVGVLYYLIRGLFRSPDAPGTGSAREEGMPESSPEKSEALEKFRAIHAKARDNLSKVQEGIDTDPRRATKAFRQLMKRE